MIKLRYERTRAQTSVSVLEVLHSSPVHVQGKIGLAENAAEFTTAGD